MNRVDKDLKLKIMPKFESVADLIEHFKTNIYEYKRLDAFQKEQVIKIYKSCLNYLCGWDSGINYDQKLYGATVGYIIRNVKEI